MKLEFQVSAKIRKPVSEVFDAVYNPDKLTGYFATGGSSGPLEPGTTVVWKWHDYPGDAPVQVIETVKNEKIVLEWQADKRDYTTRVEMRFEALEDGATLVCIHESGWRENQQDLDSSYSNCMGWTNMLACLKVYVELGVNLREFYW